MFSIILRVADTSSSTILQRQALMILTNLAFSSTHKARIVAEDKFISCCRVSLVNFCSSSEIYSNDHVPCRFEDIRYSLYWINSIMGITCRCSKSK